jgi:formylglycine-generating enzyme required for sulfatase activity
MVEQEDQDLEKLSKAQLQQLVRQLQAQIAAGASAEIGEQEAGAREAGYYRGAPPADEAEALAAYRQVLVERCAVMLPGGREPAFNATVQWPALDRVYVDLGVHSGASPADETPTRPLLEAVIEHRRLVLSGIEGAGKTTVLRRLCLALVGDCWQGLESWPEGERDLLPVLVSARAFARWLGNKSALPDAFAALLWTHISEDLAGRGLAFAEEALALAVEKGRALVLVDDLQDVPRALRKTVLDTLTDFAKSYHRTRLLITCQSSAYRERAWQLPEKRFPSVVLAPLDRGRSEQIVAAWCGESPCAGLRETLQQPDFEPLTANPLLLTLLVWLGTQHPPLPERVSGFCARTVDALLASHPAGVPADWPRVLGQTAWAACATADDPVAAAQGLVIAEDELLARFAELHDEPDREAARAALLALLGTGLLLEKEPATYAFLHPLFGTYLLSLPLALDDCFVGHALKQAQTRSALARLLVPLAAAYKVQVQQDWEPVLDLLDALCEFDEGAQAGHNAWLAGDIAAAVGPGALSRHALGAAKLGQVTQRLAEVLEQDQLTPVERAQAGDVLGNLDDPRFAAQRLFLPYRFQGQPEQGMGFVFIRAGSFWMGSEADDPRADPGEVGNVNPLQIAYPFWMARYPVTIVQYGVFVEAGGYAEENWWRGDAAKAWRSAMHRHAPDDWLRQGRHPNWPVTGITGFEAAAYCSWLDTQLRVPAHSPIPEDYEIRLPTEAEWEKAARGSSRSRFPWGNAEWDPRRANVAESGLAQPTPVGLYPKGATSTGLLDLVGNVWEWTLSGAGQYPYDPKRNHLPATANRIVRGGSWRDPAAQAHCLARRLQAIEGYDSCLGFRVVVSVAQSAFSRYQLF